MKTCSIASTKVTVLPVPEERTVLNYLFKIDLATHLGDQKECMEWGDTVL
jgi:hypothetical protein